MFIPPRILKSPARAVRILTDEKGMTVSPIYWRAVEDGTKNAQFARVDLLAANAVLMTNREELGAKFTEHAFTENHGGRWVRRMAEEKGGEYRKIMIRHAEDEERHGLLFLKLLRELGYDVSDSILGEDGHIDPYYLELHQEYGGDLYRFMCFVHAAEVRTIVYVQQVLHITVAYEDDECMAKINKTFAALYKDEKFHIRYSANIIGKMMDEGADPQVLVDAFKIVHEQTANTVNALIGSYRGAA